MNTKNLIYKIALMSTLFILAACGESFLQQSPQGQLADDQINNKKGVEYLLIGAYGLMNGNPSGTWGNYAAAPSQWLFGEGAARSEEHTSELQSRGHLVCRRQRESKKRCVHNVN